jgi:hypothetical protein
MGLDSLNPSPAANAEFSKAFQELYGRRKAGDKV